LLYQPLLYCIAETKSTKTKMKRNIHAVYGNPPDEHVYSTQKITLDSYTHFPLKFANTCSLCSLRLEVGNWGYGRNNSGWTFLCEICFEKERNRPLSIPSTPQKSPSDVAVAFNSSLQATPIKAEPNTSSTSSSFTPVKKFSFVKRLTAALCEHCPHLLRPGNLVWGWKDEKTNLWFFQCYPTCSAATSLSQATQCNLSQDFHDAQEFVPQSEAKEPTSYFDDEEEFEVEEESTAEDDEENDDDSEEEDEEEDESHVDDEVSDRDEEEEETEPEDDAPEVVSQNQDNEDDDNTDDGLGRAFDDEYVPKSKKPRRLERLKKGK
jgi:hypothetical protein